MLPDSLDTLALITVKVSKRVKEYGSRSYQLMRAGAFFFVFVISMSRSFHPASHQCLRSEVRYSCGAFGRSLDRAFLPAKYSIGISRSRPLIRKASCCSLLQTTQVPSDVCLATCPCFTQGLLEYLARPNLIAFLRLLSAKEGIFIGLFYCFASFFNVRLVVGIPVIG